MNFLKEGLAHRLSNIVCEGRRESHRQKGAVRGGWGLAGLEFVWVGGKAYIPALIDTF